jgi:single-strand DNA-binding protein
MGQIRLHSLNDVKLVGRLTKDPELRFTTQGTPVCRFRLAVGRRYKDRTSNDWKEDVAFIPCTVWRDAAERCGQRLKKGSPVFVEGRLRSRDWQTKEGQKRSDLEVEIARIQFLESMGEAGAEANEPTPAAVGVPSSGGESVPDESAGNIDDEVPF